MPIRVQDHDGTIIEFPDGTPHETISGVMRRRDQEREARSAGVDAGGRALDFSRLPRLRKEPSASYRRTFERRARERAPQGAPGSFMRGLEEFNRSGPAGLMDQMWRNVGIADDLAYWSERARGGDHLAGQAGEDFERQEQARFAEEQPNLNTASIVASVPALGGNPSVAAGRIGALLAGVSAAGVNAPFALARQEGSLPERLPGAAAETAIVGGLGAGLQGLANRLTRAPRPNSGRSRAQQFADAGVRPTQAAISGGAPAGMTKMISENFLAGAPARAHLQASINDTANAARGISGQFGQHGQPENVGEAIQAGVNRFSRETPAPPRPGRPATISTREWSFRAKANALYDDVFGLLEREEVAHLAGQTGARAEATAAQRALADIQGRVRAPNLAELVNNPRIAQLAQALQDDAGALRFSDLRALRTWVREQRAHPTLTQTIDEAALARLESALTEDIYTSAMVLGGEHAAQQLRRVDQFYRAGQSRIQNALQPFADSTGRGAYDRVIALAREGGRQNTRSLQSLRNSLRPAEWREVAATVIDDLGRPTAGNPGVLEPGAFSVEQFVTNYAKLSPEGRRILFGGARTENLAAALDNLAQVAGYQKGVERMVNASRSGVNAQNFGSLVGLANPGTMLPTVGLLTTMALTGEMLTNPAFVRWLASASRGGGPQGMRQQLAGLAQLAGRDPALVPFYTDLARQLGAPLPPQGDRRATRSSQLPRRTEQVR